MHQAGASRASVSTIPWAKLARENGWHYGIVLFTLPTVARRIGATPSLSLLCTATLLVGALYHSAKDVRAYHANAWITAR